jgi:hypothetical protein
VSIKDRTCASCLDKAMLTAAAERSKRKKVKK